MSAAGSPAPDDSEDKRRKAVAFRFCQECANLLYPKEDRQSNQLLYVCRACHAIQQHDSACTFRKHYASNVQETAGVTTDVANDPTLPRAKQTCPNCKESDAVYFQSQQRAADTGMKLYYVCINCSQVYTTV